MTYVPPNGNPGPVPPWLQKMPQGTIESKGSTFKSQPTMFIPATSDDLPYIDSSTMSEAELERESNMHSMLKEMGF